MISIDGNGLVTVNGDVLEEPYVDELALGECDLSFPYQVPENRFFVMGDHRATSIDSRSTVVGCVEKSQIVGKVFLRVWPVPRISWIGCGAPPCCRAGDTGTADDTFRQLASAPSRHRDDGR